MQCAAYIDYSLKRGGREGEREGVLRV